MSIVSYLIFIKIQIKKNNFFFHNFSTVNAYSCYQCEGESCEDPEIVACPTEANSTECFMRFDIKTNNLMQLGCLADIPPEDDIIQLIKQKTLLVCNGSNCNWFDNLPQPNQCTECSSNETEACATRPKTLTRQKLCRIFPYTQCYQRVNNGITERGCLNDLEGDEFYNCLTGNGVKCKVCEGDSCNEDVSTLEKRLMFPECYYYRRIF